jgi:hypothetical protein
MGRPTNYARFNLNEGQVRAQTIAEARYKKSMHLSSVEFLKRLRAEHERAGRYVA